LQRTVGLLQRAVPHLPMQMAALGLASGVVLATAATAHAQGAPWPTKTISMIVPYPPGGGSDALARALGQAMGERWGQSVIVENVAGADGIIGTQKVIRAPADGHTILLQVNQMLLYKAAAPELKLMENLKLVSMIQHSPLSFAVASSFPGNTMKDLIAYCKVNKCSWGSSTKYGTLIGKQLMDAAGLSDLVVHAPYKGTGPMMTDLLGGHITLGLPAVASGLPHFKSGKLKFLAVGSPERFSMVPHVQTLVEGGLQVYGNSWYGLMVHKDTPAPIFSAIVDAVKAASKNQALLNIIESNAALPDFSDPVKFAEDVRKETIQMEALMLKFPPDTN